ncbi:MAG: putative toxin-antitoxin system toxin component, PIN family [bacterium]|nr:putative toxin-antitoxin system toxin component, PIN family [bacterium]
MQRIVIDTNILVSSLIIEGYPSQVINELILVRKVSLCLSKAVWAEYIEVLNREKFSKYPSFKTNAEIILGKIDDLALYFQPNLEIDTIKDKSDNKFLELAVFSNAEFLITGNTLDFTIDKFEEVKIVTPREYWENHRPRK